MTPLGQDNSSSGLQNIEQFAVAVISPDETNRATAIEALTDIGVRRIEEYAEYPDPFISLPSLVRGNFDVVLIELEEDPERGLECIENLCTTDDLIVIASSPRSDQDLLVRCLRAGAREFLRVPFEREELEQGLIHASKLRKKASPGRPSKLMVFKGVKGGVGVTSIACSFALAMAEDKSQRTLLIDLDLPFGNIAMNMGASPEFSVADALESIDRLDSSLLSEFVVKHASGLHILCAPGRLSCIEQGDTPIEKLLSVARSEYDNVIVDSGSQFDLWTTVLCQDATSVYLIAQSGLAELRNTNLLMNEMFGNAPNVEIVLNRFQSRTVPIPEEAMEKAMTRLPNWKVPNDHDLLQQLQIQPFPHVLPDNAVSRVIREMADAANGRVKSPRGTRGENSAVGRFFGQGTNRIRGAVRQAVCSVSSLF